MAGIFSKNNRPELPGAYVNFEAARAQPLPSAQGTEVAIAGQGDWGPVDEVIRCRTEAEFRAVFGPSDNTDLYLAARQAFQGEGFNGNGGCGELVVKRFEGAGAAAVKAAITLKNTAGSPVNALPLRAKFAGTYGNKLSSEVIDGAGTNDILIIKLEGREVERYTFLQTDIKALGEEITANSDWVELAGSVVTGTALDKATDGALVGGTNGTAGTADWDTTMETLETQPFAILAAFKLTDSGVLTSIKTWTEEANESGRRFFTVVGGARVDDETPEDFEDAFERSGDMADPDILNVDGIILRDLINGPAEDNRAVLVDGSQLTARVAGIIAARGEYASITMARLANTELVAGRGLTDQVTAFEKGVITFARDSHAIAPIHIKTGLTTWTQADADADPTRPYRTYRQPKYVRTMHGIETDLTKYVEEEILGRRPIDGPTRDAVVAEAKRILSEREKQSVLQSGWTVGIDQDPPPTDEDEFIALVLNVKFGRALEQVYFSISVS